MDEVEITTPEPDDSDAPAAEIAVVEAQPAEAVEHAAVEESLAEAGSEAPPAEKSAAVPAPEPQGPMAADETAAEPAREPDPEAGAVAEASSAESPATQPGAGAPAPDAEEPAAADAPALEAGGQAAPAAETAEEPAPGPAAGRAAVAEAPALEDAAAEPAPDEGVALKPVIEAIVYIAEEPVTAVQIAAVLERPPATVERLLAELIAEYSAPARGLMIREVAGGYKMATKPEHHDVIRTFVKSLKPPLKLSLAALETLATIAYKQPITAPEIMAIRGVQGAGVLKTLLDRKLIVAAGRKNVVGRPVLYKTSKEFLVQFGLKDLSELPTLKEFEELRRLSITDEPEEKGTDAFSGAAPAGSEPGPDAVPEGGGSGSQSAGAVEPAGETAAGPDAAATGAAEPGVEPAAGLEAAAHEHDLPAGPATESRAESGVEPDTEGAAGSGSQGAGAAETAAGPATESEAEPDAQTEAGPEDGTEQEAAAAEPTAQTGAGGHEADPQPENA